MARFIVLEGLRGTGKTTVFRLLGKRTDLTCISSIPDAFETTRHIFTDLKHVEARYLFFASALAYTAQEIAELKKSGRNIIVESYLFRTVAFHRAFGAKTDIRWSSEIASPDKIFFLHCGEVTRKARLALRNKPEALWDTIAEECREEIVREYRNWPMQIIDTTTRSPDAIAAEIAEEFR